MLMVMDQKPQKKLLKGDITRRHLA